MSLNFIDTNVWLYRLFDDQKNYDFFTYELYTSHSDNLKFF